MKIKMKKLEAVPQVQFVKTSQNIIWLYGLCDSIFVPLW